MRRPACGTGMSTTHRHALDTTDPTRYAVSRRVTLVSVAVNVILTVAQVIVGVIGQSQALVADGVHTLSDLITDVMVLFALKHGAKAADEDHPYGHGRIETAMTMVLGALLLAVGIGIAVGAGMRLASAQAFVIPGAITLWTAIITLIAKEGLYRYLILTADRFDSSLLRANAWHSRSDAISSLIVVVGIGGSLLGFAYLDAVAALIVALMIAKVGGQLSWQALRELIDTGLGPADLASIRNVIRSVNGVKALSALKTRRVGGQALVDAHVVVEPTLSVSEGHHISQTVRTKLIREVVPVADVLVHIDYEDVCKPDETALPARTEILQRLGDYFRDIPEAKMIERVTLHYLDSKIAIELLLPLTLAVPIPSARTLATRFNDAVKHDTDIARVDIHFR